MLDNLGKVAETTVNLAVQNWPITAAAVILPVGVGLTLSTTVFQPADSPVDANTTTGGTVSAAAPLQTLKSADATGFEDPSQQGEPDSILKTQLDDVFTSTEEVGSVLNEAQSALNEVKIMITADQAPVLARAQAQLDQAHVDLDQARAAITQIQEQRQTSLGSRDGDSRGDNDDREDNDRRRGSDRREDNDRRGSDHGDGRGNGDGGWSRGQSGNQHGNSPQISQTRQENERRISEIRARIQASLQQAVQALDEAQSSPSGQTSDRLAKAREMLAVLLERFRPAQPPSGSTGVVAEAPPDQPPRVLPSVPEYLESIGLSNPPTPPTAPSPPAGAY